MPRRPLLEFTRGSLRARLLALLLPALALLSAVGWWFTRQDAVAASNAAYDRSLLGAIKALELNISTASGGLAVELPYRLFEFFELTASGNVHFRIASADGLVEIGSPDLPPPPQPLRTGEPQFYDASYFGEALRLGALKIAARAEPLARPAPQAGSGSPAAPDPLDRLLPAPVTAPTPGGEAREIVIQVAESTVSRQRFTAAFVRRALQRDLLLLALLVAAVVAVSTVVLRPLARLAADTRGRAADDLAPLDAAGLPADLQPLVDAVNQQLARTAQLMDQRRRFVDDASHQLRTPLTTLRAQLDYALREPDAARSRAALEALSAELDQAIRATQQLLALARSDAAAARMDEIELGALAREVALPLLPLARQRGIDLGLELPPQPLPVQGDRALLHEALANLAHNAIAHGREGGAVTIEAAADALGASLAVLDDGPGLAPEVSGHVGERFAKGRGSRGSGLGLAIAQTVIERHGGRLRLDAREDGPGLRAMLWWPRR